MANRSGLSFAHFMSQTSLRSNLDGSPADAWFPVLLSVEARTSRSNKVSTPAMSIMARRLRKIIVTFYVTVLQMWIYKIKQLSHLCLSWLTIDICSIWLTQLLAWSCSSWTDSRLCCSKCISGWEQHLGGCIYGWCQTHGPVTTHTHKHPMFTLNSLFILLYGSKLYNYNRERYIPQSGSYLLL